MKKLLFLGMCLLSSLPLLGESDGASYGCSNCMSYENSQFVDSLRLLECLSLCQERYNSDKGVISSDSRYCWCSNCDTDECREEVKNMALGLIQKKDELIEHCQTDSCNVDHVNRRLEIISRLNSINV